MVQSTGDMTTRWQVMGWGSISDLVEVKAKLCTLPHGFVLEKGMERFVDKHITRPMNVYGYVDI